MVFGDVTLKKVKSLPYPLYRKWQLFYMLEPWGWENDEYHFASILAMLHNVNFKGKRKTAKDYMRDMEEGLLDAVKEQPDIADFTKEELLKIIRQQMGAR